MRLLLTIAFIAVAIAPAAAQSLLGESWPQNAPVTDKNGVLVGTLTPYQNKAYVRDAKGELLGTIVFEGDQRILYDPSGRIVEKLTANPFVKRQ